MQNTASASSLGIWLQAWRRNRNWFTSAEKLGSQSCFDWTEMWISNAVNNFIFRIFHDLFWNFLMLSMVMYLFSFYFTEIMHFLTCFQLYLFPFFFLCCSLNTRFYWPTLTFNLLFFLDADARTRERAMFSYTIRREKVWDTTESCSRNVWNPWVLSREVSFFFFSASCNRVFLCVFRVFLLLDAG